MRSGGVKMSGHECPRCGYESRRPKGATWTDRHPAATVCAGVFVGLPALYTVAGVIVAYPWFTVPVLVVVCAVVVDLRMRRRAAIAARADWEHREAMNRAVFGGRIILPPPAPGPQRDELPGHVMNRWPTTRARRPADHWSKTEPIRRSA